MCNYVDLFGRSRCVIMWILLNWTVQKCGGRIRIGSTWFRIEITTSTCNSSNNSFGNGIKVTVSHEKSRFLKF